MEGVGRSSLLLYSIVWIRVDGGRGRVSSKLEGNEGKRSSLRQEEKEREGEGRMR